MCSDRQSIWKRSRFDGRPLFGIPGGTRALSQTIDVNVVTSAGYSRLVLPSLRGALVLKGAAYLEDARDRGRHAEDAVALLACVTDATEVWSDLSQRSRRRLRALLKVVTEQDGPWLNHDAMVQALARESLAELVALVAR